MLQIEMLPAGYGDCIWIEYGDESSPRRILIDGGIASTYDDITGKISACGSACRLELLVISHVDADHIEGIIKLLGLPPAQLQVQDVWFNGWDHLPVPPHSRLGPPQGEMLSAALDANHLPWNKRFDGHAVVVPDDGPLPEVTLPGGMKLTLLSPMLAQLAALRPVWKKECIANGLVPGSRASSLKALLKDRRLKPRRLGDSINVRKLADVAYAPDGSQTNGSSIAMLAEFEGKKCLLAADALPEVLLSSLHRLHNPTVDAYKMSHHGSRYNNSPDLLKDLQSRRYLISTDGEKFGHPDRETIARVLANGKPPIELCFNYKSAQTRCWDDSTRRREFRYDVHYPGSAAGGLVVEL